MSFLLPPWNVLVFPCGSGIAQEIYNGLRGVKEAVLFGVTSVSTEPDHGEVMFAHYRNDLPTLRQPERLLSELLGYCVTHQIHAIFSAYDDVINFLVNHREDFASIEVRIVAPSKYACDIARSKSKTYAALRSHMAVPKIYDGFLMDPFPLFVKPDAGQGSQGAKRVDSLRDLRTYSASIRDPLVLEYLPGPEFTVDCFSDRHGQVRFVQPRRRCRIRAGISVATEVVDFPPAHEMAQKIQDVLHLRGAWFFQLKLSKTDVPTLLEVGPRIGGAMALARNRGVNLPLLSLLDAMDRDVEILCNPGSPGRAEKGFTTRFTVQPAFDHVYVDLDDTLVHANNRVEWRLVGLLYSFLNQAVGLTLLTRSKEDPLLVLRRCRLDALFDDVVHITDGRPKSAYITEARAIFIDDSFHERQEVQQTLSHIPVYDLSMLEALMDDRSPHKPQPPRPETVLRDCERDRCETGVKVGALDKRYLIHLRNHVNAFLKKVCTTYVSENMRVLDIGPQDPSDPIVRQWLPPKTTYESLEMGEDAKTTWMGDITQTNEHIEANRFDLIVCTEVLEHCGQPFAAMSELYRLAKPGGFVAISVPFNFRIHGPLPDCWRFSEHGLRALVATVPFQLVSLEAMEDPGRPLAPIHYTMLVRK